MAETERGKKSMKIEERSGMEGRGKGEVKWRRGEVETRKGGKKGKDMSGVRTRMMELRY